MVNLIYKEHINKLGVVENMIRGYKVMLLVFFLIALALPVSATTVWYDNITVSPYRTLSIEVDAANIAYISEHGYKVFIDKGYYGEFKKNEMIPYPNNSKVEIYFNNPLIKTESSDLYSTVIKPTVITFLGFAITWGLLLVVVLIIGYKLWKARK